MLEKQYRSFRLGVWTDDDSRPNNFYTGNASVRQEHILRVGGFDMHCRVRLRGSVGLNMLSALYIVHYLEGARDELGAWPALRDVLAEPVA